MASLGMRMFGCMVLAMAVDGTELDGGILRFRDEGLVSVSNVSALVALVCKCSGTYEGNTSATQLGLPRAYGDDDVILLLSCTNCCLSSHPVHQRCNCLVSILQRKLPGKTIWTSILVLQFLKLCEFPFTSTHTTQWQLGMVCAYDDIAGKSHPLD